MVLLKSFFRGGRIWYFPHPQLSSTKLLATGQHHVIMNRVELVNQQLIECKRIQLKEAFTLTCTRMHYNIQWRLLTHHTVRWKCIQLWTGAPLQLTTWSPHLHLAPTTMPILAQTLPLHIVNHRPSNSQWLWARSHLHSVGPHPSHASFTARSSCLHLRGNSSPLGTNVTISSHLSC